MVRFEIERTIRSSDYSVVEQAEVGAVQQIGTFRRRVALTIDARFQDRQKAGCASASRYKHHLTDRANGWAAIVASVIDPEQSSSRKAGRCSPTM